MHTSKNYFHDRLILLMLSTSTFLTLLNTILILFRLDSSRGSYIVQYRANLSLSAFKAGDSSTFWAFVGFGFIVLAFQLLLSMKAFHFNRSFAVTISALGVLLLVLCLIVSNALLALR